MWTEVSSTVLFLDTYINHLCVSTKAINGQKKKLPSAFFINRSPVASIVNHSTARRMRANFSTFFCMVHLCFLLFVVLNLSVCRLFGQVDWSGVDSHKSQPQPTVPPTHPPTKRQSNHSPRVTSYTWKHDHHIIFSLRLSLTVSANRLLPSIE